MMHVQLHCNHHWPYILDSHDEAGSQKAAAQFARIVQEWAAKRNHPAPVNILSMPYWASVYLYRALYAGCAGRPHGMLFDQNDGPFEVDETSTAIPAGQHTLGQPSYNADLEELKDQIATQLQSQFGDYEDNGTLIDKAVKVLNRRMEEKITKIEEKIDNMAQEYKGVSHSLEELIKLMAQKPTGTSASAREE